MQAILIDRKFKDRILNFALLGAGVLLLMSFAHSTISKNTGQPSTGGYLDGKINSHSSRTLVTYDPLPLLKTDGTEITQEGNSISKLQNLPGNKYLPSTSNSKNGLLQIPETEIPILDSVKLPGLNKTINETIDPVANTLKKLL
jgi:hypothetical protein